MRRPDHDQAVLQDAPGLRPPVDWPEQLDGEPLAVDLADEAVDAPVLVADRRVVDEVVDDDDAAVVQQGLDVLPIAADGLVGVAAVDEGKIDGWQFRHGLGERPRGVAGMEVNGHVAGGEVGQVLEDLGAAQWHLADLGPDALDVGRLEEVEAEVAERRAGAGLQGGLDHLAGVAAIPDADLQDRPRAAS